MKKNHIASKKLVIYVEKNSVLIMNIKKHYKVRDHYHNTGKYRGAAHACNLRYKKPIEIIAVFHNGSKYDSHFIIKELAEEFKGQIECLEKKTEKYITFSLPLNEEIGNNKAIT